MNFQYILTIIILFTFSFLGSCDFAKKRGENEILFSGPLFDKDQSKNSPQPKQVSEIPLPEGYQRVNIDKNSFGYFLRNIPLDTADNIVHLYNGKRKWNQSAQYAILKVDVGKRDLQQCADAVMRLRAEFLFKHKKYEEISFNFTSGDPARYVKYAEGYRPSINGNQVSWKKKADKNYSYKTFRNYMDLIFAYAGSHSLQKELKKVSDLSHVNIGDVFIHGGFPGHAVLVTDVAVNKASGKKIFLLSQSYMPAQEIHILKNPMNSQLSPWYSTEFKGQLFTPEWTFKKEDLKTW